MRTKKQSVQSPLFRFYRYQNQSNRPMLIGIRPDDASTRSCVDRWIEKEWEETETTLIKAEQARNLIGFYQSRFRVFPPENIHRDPARSYPRMTISCNAAFTLGSSDRDN